VEESPGFTADGAMNMSKKKLNFQEAATLTREIIGIEDGFQKFYPFLKNAGNLFVSFCISSQVDKLSFLDLARRILKLVFNILLAKVQQDGSFDSQFKVMLETSGIKKLEKNILELTFWKKKEVNFFEFAKEAFTFITTSYNWDTKDAQLSPSALMGIIKSNMNATTQYTPPECLLFLLLASNTLSDLEPIRREFSLFLMTILKLPESDLRSTLHLDNLDPNPIRDYLAF